MNRAFKYFTIQDGGTPQPLVGTYLTAPVTSAQIAAANNGSGINMPIMLAVADSSMFLQSDYVMLVDPETYAAERVMVTAIPGSATSLMVTGLQNPHPGGAYGTGAWVALGAMSQSVYVQGKDGNTGALYLGTKPQMVTATGTYMLTQVKTVAAGTQPYEFSTSRQGLAETETLSQYWIDGTTGDGYLASIGVV